MGKDKQPKDDLRTVAKSRMAAMPGQTAGGRLDQGLIDPDKNEPKRQAAPIAMQDKQRTESKR